MKQFWQKVVRYGHRLNEQTQGWLGLLVGAAQKAVKPNAMIKAAAIAYFALFSLFPLILLSISIASIRLGSLTLMDQRLVVQRLEFIAPALGQLLGQNINNIILERGPVSGVALLVLIWSSSTVFYILTNSLNEIWDVERRRPVWRQRGVAILVVLGVVVPALFLASFVGSLLAALGTLLPATIIQIASSVSWGVIILLNVVMFMLLYLMLPHGNSTWREILPGALAAGLLWELAKRAFLFFVSTYIVASNLVYGSVAAIIAFLTWAYLSGLILLFGAHLSVAYYQLKRNALKQQNRDTLPG
jgi:membrane protein